MASAGPKGSRAPPAMAPETVSSSIDPCSTSRWASRVCGWYRYIRPSAHTRRASAAASKARRASSGLTANGFSQRTCLPALSALTVHSMCIEIGSAT